jgi:hypothetical protein
LSGRGLNCARRSISPGHAISMKTLPAEFAIVAG